MEMPNPIEVLAKIKDNRDLTYLAAGVSTYALMLMDDAITDNLQKFIVKAAAYGQQSESIIELVKEVYRGAVINAVLMMATPLKMKYDLTVDELTSALALGWQQAQAAIEGGLLGKTEDVEEE